jgi:flagellar secretion chaperone FliS
MMNPYNAYRRQEATPGWTRIDMLLALYDGAIERLKKSAELFRRNQASEAIPLLARTQLILSELAAGVRPEIAGESGAALLQLYLYIVDRIKKPDAARSEEGAKLLETVREGFAAIRDQAADMERRGEIPNADRVQTLSVSA